MFTVWLQADMTSILLSKSRRICGDYCTVMDLAGATLESSIVSTRLERIAQQLTQ